MTTQKQYIRIVEISKKKIITPEDLEELRFLEIDLTQQQARAINYEQIKQTILSKIK